MSVQSSSATTAGYGFVLGGAMLWGTTGTAQAFAPAGYDPLVIGTLRLLVGGLALLCLALWRRELGRLQACKPSRYLWAAALTAGYQLCFFAAVAKTGVAIGTVVGIGSAPIAGGLLGFLFAGETLRRRWYLATLLAISGCVLLSFTGGEVRVDLFGIVLAIGAGAFYAAFTLILKDLLQGQPLLGVTALVFCLGALLLCPLLLRADPDWLLQPRSLVVALHLGVAATACAYILFSRGLRTVPVSAATTLSLAEPMTAACLGILVLGEQLTLLAFAGIALIFSGLLVLVWNSGKKYRGAPS